MTDNNINVNLISSPSTMRNYHADTDTTDKTDYGYDNNNKLFTSNINQVLRDNNTPKKVRFNDNIKCDFVDNLLVNFLNVKQLPNSDLRHRINKRKHHEMNNRQIYEIKRNSQRGPDKEVNLPPVAPQGSCIRKPFQNLAEMRLVNLRKKLEEKNLEQQTNYHLCNQLLQPDKDFMANEEKSKSFQNGNTRVQNIFGQKVNVSRHISNDSSCSEVLFNQQNVGSQSITNMSIVNNPEIDLTGISPSTTRLCLTDRFTQFNAQGNPKQTHLIGSEQILNSTFPREDSNNYMNNTTASAITFDNNLFSSNNYSETPQEKYVSQAVCPTSNLGYSKNNTHSRNEETYPIRSGFQEEDYDLNSYNFSNINAKQKQNIPYTSECINREITLERTNNQSIFSEYPHGTRIIPEDHVTDYETGFRDDNKTMAHTIPGHILPNKICRSNLPNTQLSINSFSSPKQNIPYTNEFINREITPERTNNQQSIFSNYAHVMSDHQHQQLGFRNNQKRIAHTSPDHMLPNKIRRINLLSSQPNSNSIHESNRLYSYSFSDINSTPKQNIPYEVIKKEITPEKTNNHQSTFSNYADVSRIVSADHQQSRFWDNQKKIASASSGHMLPNKITKTNLPNTQVSSNPISESKSNIAQKPYSANERLKKFQANLRLSNELNKSPAVPKTGFNPIRNSGTELKRYSDESVSEGGFQNNKFFDRNSKITPDNKKMSNVNMDQPEKCVRNDVGQVKNLANTRLQKLVSTMKVSRTNNVTSSKNDSGQDNAKEPQNYTAISDNYESEQMDWETIPEEVVILKVRDVRCEIASKFIEGPTSVDVKPVSFTRNDEWYIVIDTNVFLSNLSFVKKLLQTDFKFGNPIILIPWMVLQELDYIKDSRNSYDAQRLSLIARSAIAFLNDMIEKGHPRIRGQTAQDANIEIIKNNRADDKILNCCFMMMKSAKQVILLSNDKNLRSKALVNKIPAYSKESLIPSVELLFESKKSPVNNQVNSEQSSSIQQRTSELDNIKSPVKENVVRESPPCNSISVQVNNEQTTGGEDFLMRSESSEDVNRITAVQDILGLILKFCQLFCEHIFDKLGSTNNQNNAVHVTGSLNILRTTISDLKLLLQTIKSLFENITHCSLEVINENMCSHLTILLGRFMTKYQGENTVIPAADILMFLRKNWDKVGAFVEQLDTIINSLSYAESELVTSNTE